MMPTINTCFVVTVVVVFASCGSSPSDPMVEDHTVDESADHDTDRTEISTEHDAQASDPHELRDASEYQRPSSSPLTVTFERGGLQEEVETPHAIGWELVDSANRVVGAQVLATQHRLECEMAEEGIVAYEPLGVGVTLSRTADEYIGPFEVVVRAANVLEDLANVHIFDPRFVEEEEHAVAQHGSGELAQSWMELRIEGRQVGEAPVTRVWGSVDITWCEFVSRID